MTTAKSFEDFTGPQLSFVLSALTGKKVGRINSLASAHARVATAVKAKGLTLARAFSIMQDWRERDINHDDFGTLAHVFECAAIADAAEQAPAKPAKPESAARRMERDRKEAVARKKADKAAAKAAAPAKAPKAGKLTTLAAARAAGGQRAAIQAAAEAGTLPTPPDFSADTHKPYRAKLAKLVELVAGGAVAELEAFEIKLSSTSPKALDRYRNLAVTALKARAAQPQG